MNNETFNIDHYLKRINFQRKPEISLAFLKGVHQAHVMNVPFENIDIFQRKEISLDISVLYNKIITEKKGGYCFELNGIFEALLKKIGFNVRGVLARVYKEGFGNYGKTHQALIVEINEGCYLCDVGFGGDGIIKPILLQEGQQIEQLNRYYRIVKDSKYGYILQIKEACLFKPIYAFSLEYCNSSDYEIINYFTSTHPNSTFTQKLICTKPLKTGRITLVNQELKIIRNNIVEKKHYNSQKEAIEKFVNHHEK